MIFNVIDIVLVLVVLLSVLNGFRRGFVLSALDLLGWLASLFAGLRFYQPVARWLGPRVDLWSEVWDQPIAFLLIAIVAGVLIRLLGNALLRRLPKDVHKRRVNRIFGIAPGFVNGVITAGILAALLLAIPLNESLRERARESAGVNRLAVFAERLESALAPVFDDAIAQTLNRLTIRPESNERVELPYNVANSRPRPALEAEMLELVNEERRAAGLAPLAPDSELTEVARRHSADMWARGYFA
ncbi:MAG: CvpA family protein, partial [Pyrinomonadaceae bacterium]|nr:CvpA family protein [Pyrinomonadaceae bacterium]